MEQVSGLRFTIENSIGNKIPFLDVYLEAENDKFTTTVYRKPTDTGTCMNGRSECSEEYKRGVIRAYVRRALIV